MLQRERTQSLKIIFVEGWILDECIIYLAIAALWPVVASITRFSVLRAGAG